MLESVHANNDLITPTSISHSNLLHNILIINNENEILVDSGIPRIFNVNISQVSLNKGPYNKYKFPGEDPPLSEAGMMHISKIESLEYLVNLFCGRLDPGLKEEWDKLAGRDISVPEISAAGMQLTQYDIRQQCSLYKKAREKESYVNNLSGKFSPKNLNSMPPISSHPVDVFPSGLLQNEVPKFQAPSSGLLFQFLLESGYEI